jgi:hypothetical protein
MWKLSFSVVLLVSTMGYSSQIVGTLFSDTFEQDAVGEFKTVDGGTACLAPTSATTSSWTDWGRLFFGTDAVVDSASGPVKNGSHALKIVDPAPSVSTKYTFLQAAAGFGDHQTTDQWDVRPYDQPIVFSTWLYRPTETDNMRFVWDFGSYTQEGGIGVQNNSANFQYFDGAEGVYMNTNVPFTPGTWAQLEMIVYPGGADRYQTGLKKFWCDTTTYDAYVTQQDGTRILLAAGIQANSHTWYVKTDSPTATDFWNGGARAVFYYGSETPNNGDTWYVDDVTIARLPEPATISLLGCGILGLLRRKK